MNLKEKYEKIVVPEMIKKFGYKNKFQVPRLEKVVLNVGFGKMVLQKTKQEAEKMINTILEDLKMISGQKPVLTLARKSISGFKLKKGEPVGAKVTLRKKRMYDFVEKLINISLPRIRDFKGIPVKSVNERGILTIGIKEHLCFPEISLEKVKFPFGLEVTLVTTAKKREEAIELFKLLGFPIKTAD
jgi:large subunit ribosomal protein L5